MDETGSSQRAGQHGGPRRRARDGGSVALGLMALACLLPCGAPVVVAALAATGLAHLLAGPFMSWFPVGLLLVGLLVVLVGWSVRARRAPPESRGLGE
jgi:hypothetical protein